MDKNVVEEGNCKRSDSTHPDANSGVAKIEPSQLHNATEKYKADGCNHFSIRGYVAEVRKKDKTICWPFSNVGDHEIMEEEIKLPPLQVPEFRWWKCQNCLRKKGAKDTSDGTGVVTNCSNSVCETKTIPSPVIPFPLSCGDPQKLYYGFQESSEVNLVDGMKTSSDVSLHVDKKEKTAEVMKSSSDVSLHVVKKEKTDEVLVDPITKDIHKLTDNVEEENKNMEICGPTYSLMEVDIPNGEKGCGLSSGGTANVTPSKSKVYKLIKGSCEIHQKETGTLKPKGDELVNSSKEIFHTEMQGNVIATTSTSKVYKLVKGSCELGEKL
ncbi:protein EMBRYONIC FLOWER 1-like isoform X2 [Macadamia integrifolia]|nr:protein EMBRYONIC FLOWER 1-like isoform X2 [Macadamia integrifolia]XP_042515711.1 protein EMBRYONIC FLOWER 1-like isoform X2 [Macadamia integrifolia]XP_042515712.1 protein EMBRYONIC FLOWER 1-like isoform X2 [Macadamia integrifolia]XP_042515713.1 protein EMBRYONIC FLOWER 1-like isoform X2 [Macadamia integrifolia]XP_042515714.1 protein EMBRYONIC FLOWER 1-like isoform X2 [Macadamia integrifolia]XP_042515715.1 protein EMBRYONIC FLOWER 1-like isoform X2 [Macadamia integrifolia]XP_042515716.1 pr